MFEKKGESIANTFLDADDEDTQDEILGLLSDDLK